MDTGSSAKAGEAPEKKMLLTKGTEGKRKYMAVEFLGHL